MSASPSRSSTWRAWQLFRGQHPAIGELMMIPTDAAGAARHECLGYVQFCARLDQDPEFAGWFARLRGDLDDLAAADRGDQRRLIDMQHALIDLIEFLDPDRQRLPAKYRDRLRRQPPPHA